MKKLASVPNVHLDEFDINVIPYIGYAEVQQICNAVKNEKSWSEKETGIDMLLLYHCTDIPKDVLDTLPHNMALRSGLIDGVKGNIFNLEDVYKAIEFETSVAHSLNMIASELPKYKEILEKELKKHGSKNG